MRYYRLKQTDFDGKYEYFGPVIATCTPANDWDLVMQNIFNSSSLTGTLIAAEDADLILHVVDMQGRIIKQEKRHVQKGSNYIHVELNDVDAGMYFISLQNTRVNLQQKFIKN